MKHGEHAVVVVCRRDLVEEAVRVQGQQLALLSQHRPPVVQVPFVAHDHDVHLVFAEGVFGGLDALNELADGIETGSVADAVDQNEAICPLDLLTAGGRLHQRVL